MTRKSKGFLGIWPFFHKEPSVAIRCRGSFSTWHGIDPELERDPECDGSERSLLWQNACSE
jgi:hypothetical protein